MPLFVTVRKQKQFSLNLVSCGLQKQENVSFLLIKCKEGIIICNVICLCLKPSDGEDADDESEEGDGAEQPSTTGSLGAQYGGANDLFYSQFELHTRQQKRNQIILLQDAIYRIKMAFNKEFDEVYRAREQEITRIGDRNQRILKIMVDLSSKDEVWKPQMDADEKPEKLLTVEDSEVSRSQEEYYRKNIT